jgi:adenylate cyclase
VPAPQRPLTSMHLAGGAAPPSRLPILARLTYAPAMRPRFGSRFQAILLLLLGAGLTAGVGWACLIYSFSGLERLSYDLPYLVQSNVATPEICLVTIDEGSAVALQQPLNAPWDRTLHAELLRALTKAGARAVMFDLSFDAPSPKPGADEELAAAMKENGHVYIGATFLTRASRETYDEQVVPPIGPLRDAAAGWGLLQVRRDRDYTVRRIFPGTEEIPAITWRMARKFGAALPETPDPDAPARWLNYYARPGRFASASFQQALHPAANLPPRFFEDRLVIVGGQKSLGSLNEERDQFMTPYSLWDKNRNLANGMEIHATTLLNLLHGEWMTRLSPSTETRLIVLLGLGIAAFLSFVCSFCPFRMTLVAGVVMIAGVAAVCWGAWQQRLWFNWLIPAAIETPFALFWSLTSRYFLEARQQRAIRRAFGLYLSPHMANEIAQSRFDLKPGGKLVEATMIFTDLEGFVTLSGRLHDASQISDVLTAYFNNTTQHVLKQRGTILKYFGDSVFAAWGAPLPDNEQAYHAVRAAWDMHQYAKLTVHGHQLTTRIGVHSGTVLAGNLGSDFRFDYTLIGDPVNLASRLESLNKHLGTQLLISDHTWRQVAGRFAGRSLGKFCVKGSEEPIIVHEMLGEEVSTYVQETIATFARGVAAFQTGDLVKARASFEQTRSRFGGKDDGPSQFFLQMIAEYQVSGLPTGWDGVVNMLEK